MTGKDRPPSLWARLHQPIEGPVVTPLLRALKWALAATVLLIGVFLVDTLFSVGTFYRTRTVEESLRSLAEVQDSLYAARGRYEADLDSLAARWVPFAGGEARIDVTPGGDGWSVSLTGRYSETLIGCVLYVGPVASVPSTPLGVRPEEPGRVACDPYRPISRFLARQAQRLGG